VNLQIEMIYKDMLFTKL